jgi:hypothetical protein
MVKPLEPCVKKPSRPGAVVDLDPSDFAVRVRIEFDRNVVGSAGGGAFRHFNEAGGAAKAKRRRRCRYFHVARFGHRGGDKSHRAFCDIEQRRVGFSAILVDKVVDRDPRMAVRLNVVESLKVTPRVEFAEVCNTSFRKMSSFSFSGVDALLRVTAALPVRVATFPIGSSAAGCAAAGAETGAFCGAGAGAGCTCAKALPAVTRQHSSHAANETRCLFTSDLPEDD